MEIFLLVCPRCGSDITLNRKTHDCFCPYCGTKFIFDDGIKRSEHTIRYRDEAILKELELNEQRRIQREQAYKDEKARKEIEEIKTAKRKAFKLLFYVFLAFGLLVFFNVQEKREEKKYNPALINPTWYNQSAVVLPEVLLTDETKTLNKGPLTLIIPDDWEIGESTVDASHSVFYAKTSSVDMATIDVYIEIINENSSSWNSSTWKSRVDSKIRELTKNYRVQDYKPMMIGDKKGVHAIAKERKRFGEVLPVHVFLVPSENYYCYIVLSGSSSYQVEKHLDEVYFVTQNMAWDFS